MFDMTESNFIYNYMQQYFDELTPKEFYRNIFAPGELASHQERTAKGKYHGIAVELLPKEENNINARRYIITDELDILDKLLEKDNFIIISPISYIGRSRKSENARHIYAMAIDLDGITKENNLRDLFYQIENEVLPKPTYIVTSGNGLHLYYQFEKPISCYKKTIEQLQRMKSNLTKKIWNQYVTTLSDKPQIESLFQGFRMCGGVTKDGHRTKAFVTGDKVTIEYLNGFVFDDKCKVKEVEYKSELSLEEAKKKYPEWYKKRIEQQKPKGTWQCKIDLYNWWLNRIKSESTVGHRYFCIGMLAVYAKKSGVDREQLEHDAFSLLDKMDELTVDENNKFTREDIFSALELYNDNYITFPIDTISQLTNIHIEKNKRNGRTQEIHLERARAVQAIDYPNGEWRNKKGRPTKEKIVTEWRQSHPGAKPKDCITDTGISKNTVYRYWKGEHTKE